MYATKSELEIEAKIKSEDATPLEAPGGVSAQQAAVVAATAVEGADATDLDT
jgi:hypothetical protein